MKKFLALVLALVMTMSLVTISAGAKDFDDNADITYVEAVDVMSDLKIVDGDTAGNFNPTNGLTRGAAAKIICNLVLGPTTAAELNADTDPFVDVDKDSTFAGYIAYCAKEGIVGGYADGSFKPAAPLTGYAFMKMLLGALGYDAAVEGYTGANWSINVAKQAIGIGLNADLVDNFNGSDFVTREEAMLYAFNTMKATMVDYDTTITIGDITVAGSNEYDVANNARVETIYNDGKMQFAEKYFSKLVLDEDTFDVFGRPTNTWINGKETIGSYVDYTEIVAEYTTAVSGKELYDVVGKTAFADYDFYGYVDGKEVDFTNEIAKNNKADISVSGNGALMQVFVNEDAEYVIVSVVNTYLAQAIADYNAKKDSVSFNIFDDVMTYTNGTVSGEDFDIADVKEDDFVLVTYADGEIQSIEDVEIIADTEIQSFKAGKAGNMTVDGTKYNYSLMAEYDADVLKAYTEVSGETNLKDLTYNVYVDTYGYVIGVDLVETPDNFLFITAVDEATSNLTNKTFTANAIFMDGTVAVIDVKNNGAVSGDASVNAWFKYTVNNDGVYTLATIAEANIYNNNVAGEVSQDWTGKATVSTIDAKHIALTANGGKCYGNDASIYLLAELDEVKGEGVIAGVDEVVTGVKNAAFSVYNDADVKAALADNTLKATANGVYALYKDNGYVIAAVVVGESDTVSKNVAYVHSTGVSSESYNKVDKVWTWTRDVVIDGVEVELVESNDTGLSVLKTLNTASWYEIKYDAKDFVKKAVLLTANGDDYVTTIEAAVQRVEADEETIIVDVATSTNKYSLIGNTLYDLTSKELGFLVAEDVKVVLTQTNKNKTTTTFDEGVKALEATLADLNEKSGVKYAFDAIVENGFATVVIIVDANADTAYVGPDGSNLNVVDATVVGDEIFVEAADILTQAAAMEAALADAGYTNISIDLTQADDPVVTANKGAIKVAFDVNPVSVGYSRSYVGKETGYSAAYLTITIDDTAVKAGEVSFVLVDANGEALGTATLNKDLTLGGALSCCFLSCADTANEYYVGTTGNVDVEAAAGFQVYLHGVLQGEFDLINQYL